MIRQRLALALACALSLSACHPHDVRHVERTTTGYVVQVSAQCGAQGLAALFERTARNACKGDYRIVNELPQMGHMWGTFGGECMVGEREAQIECIKDTHP